MHKCIPMHSEKAKEPTERVASRDWSRGIRDSSKSEAVAGKSTFQVLFLPDPSNLFGISISIDHVHVLVCRYSRKSHIFQDRTPVFQLFLLVRVRTYVTSILFFLAG